MSSSSRSCELAFVKLFVFSACRFTQMLSDARRPIRAARTISSHGTHRRQPASGGVVSCRGALAAASGGRATSSLAKLNLLTTGSAPSTLDACALARFIPAG
jgi:hypothetical protein